jgi:VWFA-related protein
LRRILFALIPFLAWAQNQGDPAVFHSSTRLVEMQVTVRNQRVRPPGVRAALVWALDSGPPFGSAGTPVQGLTKDDFVLLDQGKPQRIAIFGTQPVHEKISFPLPPGDVSNRTDYRGEPLAGATAVLVDLLNTPWQLSDYARLGMTELVRTLKDTQAPIALYSLGKELHILHDFTDDPRYLRDAAAHLESHGRLPFDFSTALEDYGYPPFDKSWVAAERITRSALTSVIQHLSGFSGRKSLVWLAQAPRIPPEMMRRMQQANIALYPVRVRGLGGFADLEGEVSRELGNASGGRGFFDARDLAFAVQAATEDSGSAYVLGYYPDEAILDGKFHRITVKLADQPLEVHYRSGYLATKDDVPATTAKDAANLAELMESPMNSSGMGLGARAERDTGHQGFYEVPVTVDLHDVKMERKAGHFVGKLDFAIPGLSSQRNVRTGEVTLNLTDAQLASALENGYTFTIKGVEFNDRKILLVVRDHATGAAGSLLITLPKESEK